MVIGESPVSQARVRMASGEYRWMLHRTEPLMDAAGRITRWFGSSIDIEDLKRAEQEPRDLKQQLHQENIALRDEVSQADAMPDTPQARRRHRRRNVDKGFAIADPDGADREMARRRGVRR